MSALKTLSIYKLKGRFLYLSSEFVSFLRVVPSFTNLVILSAQKAAVRYFIRIHVYPKRNKLCLQNQAIASLLNLNRCCFQTRRPVKSERYRDFRICSTAGNMYGTLHMRTSHRLSVAGETRKHFSTSLGELKNGSAFKLENIKEKKFKFNWFKNDKKLFERAVSIEALKKAWGIVENELVVSSKSKGFSVLNTTKVSESWFISANEKLLKSSFKYPNRKKSSVTAIIKLKIIEKAFLNALEPLFEGYSQWEQISKKDWDLGNSDFLDKSNYRIVKQANKTAYQKKNVVNKAVFTPHSYGFRLKKSAHQALNEVRHWRVDTAFLIDYSVNKKFENVNGKRLKNLFNNQVCDIRFWVEISKILNSGITLELNYLFNRKKIFQKSILSPFLLNIYLHELDKKIIGLQKKTAYAEKSYESSIYGNQKAKLAHRKLLRDFAAGNLKKALKKYGTKEILLEARKIAYKEHHNKYGRRRSVDLNSRHIQYIRYANNFLIGIVGNREYAIQVRKEVDTFLKSNLHLVVAKANLVHRNKNSAFFLGHSIKLSDFKLKLSIKPKQIRAAKKNKNKSTSRFLELDKRLAKAKSYQLYSNVLLQFDTLSKKLKMGVKNKKHIDLLSLFFAYQSVGVEIMQKLSLTSWDKFLELLILADSSDMLEFKPNNSATYRWASYLKAEAVKLNKFSAIIFHEKLLSQAKFGFYNKISKGQADKIKTLQLSYLNDINLIMRKSLDFELDKKFKTINGKFSMRLNFSKRSNVKNPSLPHLAQPEKLIHRCIFIKAPLSEIFNKLRSKSYIHPIKNKAIGNLRLEFYTDLEIVRHFNSVIRELLNCFSGANNFFKIKGLAQLLRKSCVLTLANKHKKDQNWVYIIYGNEIKVKSDNNQIFLVSRADILNYPNKFDLESYSFYTEYFNLGENTVKTS